jgi:drug/metabolite transporter superfamily protein YnfA
VYVYARSAGTWSQQAYVKASNTGAGDNFGISVALSGDGNTLAVGARGEDSAATGIGGNQTDDCGVASPINCASDSGAVYVYTRSAGAWSQQAYVKASNTEASDLFGNSVALSGNGNTLAVGAVFESSARFGVIAGSVSEATAGNDASAAGAVYVYSRNGGAWSQQAYVKASNTETFDLFGNSVALSGDGNTLAVGAVWEASGSVGINSTANESAFGAGAVYVYTFAAGAWSQQAYVKASNSGASDEFGTSVALSGDGNTLAVGAPFEAGSGTGIGSASNESAANAGAAYVYNRIGAAWSQQAYVKASNTEAGDNFGWSVALSGDGNALAVGAYLENSAATGIDGNQTNDCGVASPFNCAADSGAVYVYTRAAGTWSQQAYAKTPNPEFNDQFGHSVALSGDGNTLAVGARREDGSTPGVGGTPNNSATDAGAVYLY